MIGEAELAQRISELATPIIRRALIDAPTANGWEHPRAYAGFDPTQKRAVDGTWTKEEEEEAVEVEDADSPIVKLHLKMLAKIPPRLRRILAEAGVRWQISAKSVGAMRPDLENPPRGWPEGTTWDDVAGVYLPGEQLILVGRAQEGSASVMLHETGHALAHVLTLDNEQALVALQKAKGIKPGSYYAGAAGREELLAESFAVRISLGQAEAKRRYGKKYVAWLDATLGIPPDKKPAQTGPVTLARAFSHPREYRFDPNQPRDREGKWVDRGAALLEALKDGMEARNPEDTLGPSVAAFVISNYGYAAKRLATRLRDEPSFMKIPVSVQMADEHDAFNQPYVDHYPEDPVLSRVDAIAKLWGSGAGRGGGRTVAAVKFATHQVFQTPLPHVAQIRALKATIHGKHIGDSGVRAYVRALWKLTQDELARDGVTELKLYRGHSLDQPSNSPFGMVTADAASSWTTEEAMAVEFASGMEKRSPLLGMVDEVTVPASAVLALPTTGLGDVSVGEVILVGGIFPGTRKDARKVGRVDFRFDPDQPRAPDGKWAKVPGLGDPAALVQTLRGIAGMMDNANPRSRGIGPYNHVLRQGRVFKGFRPIEPDERNNVKRQCFQNATHLALGGATYVEGYAFSGDLGLPIHHAWVVDEQGRVYDPTWGNPEGSSYVGIPIGTDWLVRAISESGVYGVLSETSRGVLLNGIPDEAVVDIGEAIPAP